MSIRKPQIIIIGKNGQIGWELHKLLNAQGYVRALARDEIDLADERATRDMIRHLKPDIIINAAAYTMVDKAEDEPVAAMAVNGRAPGILAEEAKRMNALLVHYSTDYVFDGTKTTPYTENDLPNPMNVYGKTKLLGEQAVESVGGRFLILRISWIYGLRGRNFLLTILRLSKEKKELKVVNDQIGAPTWSWEVANATANMLIRNEKYDYKSGIYHLSAAGETSWYGFTKAILAKVSDAGHQVPDLQPVTTAQFPVKAKRPAYSVLSNVKANRELDLVLPDWDKSLTKALCVCQRTIF